jgi:type IX secretion system PorP/SprF family membrane protein
MTHALKTTIIALTLSGTTPLFAQQTALFTQFWNTQLQTNPATAGMNYRYNAYLTYDNQRFNPGQINANAGYAMKIDRIKSGVGISYAYRNYSFDHTQAAMLHYAKHFQLGASLISVGAAGGVRTYSADWDKLTYGDMIMDSTVIQTSTRPRGTYDPALDVSAGIAYQWNELNVGFSVTQLNSPRFGDTENGFINSTVPLYWFSADYTFQLPAKIDLRPQYQLATDGKWTTHQASLMAVYNKRLWAGINYRSEKTIGGMIGYDIREKFRLGAGYNFTKSQLNNGTTYGSVQVVLAWTVK